MKTYNEKFGLAKHQLMHTGIATEGIFDLFKRKQKEQDLKWDKIEDVLGLFVEQSDFIKEDLRSTEKETFTIKTSYFGNIKTSDDLLESFKGYIKFIDQLIKATGVVLSGFKAQNELTMAFYKSSSEEDIVKRFIKLRDYEIKPSFFEGLKQTKATFKEHTAGPSTVLTDQHGTIRILIQQDEQTNYVKEEKVSESTAMHYYGSYVFLTPFHRNIFVKNSGVSIDITKSDFIKLTEYVKEVVIKLQKMYNLSGTEFAKLENKAIELNTTYNSNNKFDGPAKLANNAEMLLHREFTWVVPGEFVQPIHSILKNHAKP